MALTFVSVLTPTYNRRKFIPTAIACFKAQEYPQDRMEWIILDDGSDKVKDIFDASGLKNVRYVAVPEGQKLPIGAKRNRLNELAKGEIVVCWDDDDFYPPQRIQVSVEALEKNPERIITGCEIMTVFLSIENVLMDVGPYGTNHATAATYLFRASAAEGRRFLATANKAEEGTFTRDWTLPMIMLPTKDILLVIGHAQNTVNKSEILKEPRKFGARIHNADNAKNLVRFQWIKDQSMWEILSRTFLGAS